MTPETKIKKAIKEYLNLLGIDHYYNLQGMGGYPGLPDMCFFDKRDNMLVFLEVKTPKGKMSPHQIKFKEMIKPYKVKHLMARSVDDVIEFLK